jgi:predicted acetyltransferase
MLSASLCAAGAQVWQDALMQRPTDDAAPAELPYSIRTPAAAEELRAYLAPLPLAFGEEYDDDELEADSHVFELDRITAAFDGEQSVGCAGCITLRLTVPGGEVDAAGLTLVGVLPSHRRRGILRALMRRQLDDIRRRGEPLAILWASEGAIYGRFGFGLATLQGGFEVDRSRTAYARPLDQAGTIRLVAPDEAETLFPAVYDRVREATPGFISRSEAMWHWTILRDSPHQRRGAGPKVLAVHEVDGQPEGYAIYRLKPDWDHRGPRGEVIVREVTAATPRAEIELWRWLLDTDLSATVRTFLASPKHPLLLTFAEPRALGLRLGDALWARLVDLPAALAARSYATAGVLVLDVRDELCPWNAGRWQLAVEVDASGRSRAEITPVDREPDLALDVADLAAAYLGGFSFDDLARVGRVAERRPGSIAAADRLFATSVTPYCSTMF